METAGLQLTTYNKLLQQLKEQIPIIGNGAFCDASGNWYAMDAVPEEHRELMNQ